MIAKEFVVEFTSIINWRSTTVYIMMVEGGNRYSCVLVLQVWLCSLFVDEHNPRNAVRDNSLAHTSLERQARALKHQAVA